MDVDELESLVYAGDIEPLIVAMGPMEPQQRSRLSMAAKRFERLLIDARMAGVWFPEEAAQCEVGVGIACTLGRPLNQRDLLRAHRCAEVAVFGLCPISVLKRLEPCLSEDEHDNHTFVRIMKDRQPVWLDEYIQARLQSQEPTALSWLAYRELQKAGLCQRPDYDEYLAFFAGEVDRYYQQEDITDPAHLVEWLRANPDLIEHELWRLFDTPVRSFSPYGWEGGDSVTSTLWPMAIKRLVEAGDIDRGRLLDAVFEGLFCDYGREHITGIQRLFDYLDPSDGELAAREPLIRVLLSSRYSHNVGYGLKQLTRLQRSGLLDAAGLVSACGPVFTIDAKSHPKKLLGMLKRVVKSEPALTAAVGEQALQGLLHSAQDVQRETIALLGECIRHVPELRVQLTDYENIVSIALHESLVAIGGSSVQGLAVPDESVDLAARLQDLESRAESYKAYHVASHWQEALEAVGQQRIPPLHVPPLRSIPFLNTLETVQPITDVDELLGAVAHLIEVRVPAIELERVLDGVSRLGRLSGEAIVRKAAPLLQRFDNRRDVVDYWYGKALGPLLGHWLDRGSDWPGSYRLGLNYWQKKYQEFPCDPVFQERVKAVYRRLSDNITMRALALPTHAYGWIAPEELAMRLAEMQSAGIEVHDYDFIQALFRMAPVSAERRTALYAALESVQGEPKEILVRALGLDNGADTSIPDTLPWQAADFLAGVHSALMGEEGEPGENSELPHYRWWVVKDSIECCGEVMSISDIKIDVTAESDRAETLSCLPCDIPYKRDGHGLPYGWEELSYLSLLSLYWPANPAPLLHRAVLRMADRKDDKAKNAYPHYVYLERLLQPYLPLDDMALLAISFGMIVADADVRAVTGEVIIAACQEERLDMARLGETLSRLVSGEYAVIKRIADAITPITAVSDTHALAVWQCLGALYQGLDKLPKNLHALLEITLELAHRFGLAVDDKVAHALGPFDKGGSKSAKLCRQILQHRPEQFSVSYIEAITQRLQFRLDNMAAWSGHVGDS